VSLAPRNDSDEIFDQHQGYQQQPSTNSALLSIQKSVCQNTKLEAMRFHRSKNPSESIRGGAAIGF